MIVPGWKRFAIDSMQRRISQTQRKNRPIKEYDHFNFLVEAYMQKKRDALTLDEIVEICKGAVLHKGKPVVRGDARGLLDKCPKFCLDRDTYKVPVVFPN